MKKLPPIFPIIHYNSKKRSAEPEQSNQLIEVTISGKYIPLFSYYKKAEKEFSREFLSTIKDGASALFYSENISIDKPKKEFKTLFGLLQSENRKRFRFSLTVLDLCSATGKNWLMRSEQWMRLNPYLEIR